ncbi:hypothetical protein C8J57DRAFT_1722049, partial [Mycena rebaudengoi]
HQSPFRTCQRSPPFASPRSSLSDNTERVQRPSARGLPRSPQGWLDTGAVSSGLAVCYRRANGVRRTGHSTTRTSFIPWSTSSEIRTILACLQDVHTLRRLFRCYASTPNRRRSQRAVLSGTGTASVSAS